MDQNKDFDSRQFEEYVMNYIYENWPKVRSYVPDHTVFLVFHPRIGAGLCTHPEILKKPASTVRKGDLSGGYGGNLAWVQGGGREFVIDVLPDSFFWIGLQYTPAWEYLLLMWFRNGRKFYFYDHYVCFVQQLEGVSQEHTRERLDRAFERWETTTEDVIYSVHWTLEI